jgi:hypothetical protein
VPIYTKFQLYRLQQLSISKTVLVWAVNQAALPPFLRQNAGYSEGGLGWRRGKSGLEVKGVSERKLSIGTLWRSRAVRKPNISSLWRSRAVVTSFAMDWRGVLVENEDRVQSVLMK